MGSNPAGGMDFFVVGVVFCQVDVSASDDHSSREVAPSVVCTVGGERETP